jgi:hypothetical protein
MGPGSGLVLTNRKLGFCSEVPPKFLLEGALPRGLIINLKHEETTMPVVLVPEGLVAKQDSYCTIHTVAT